MRRAAATTSWGLVGVLLLTGPALQQRPTPPGTGGARAGGPPAAAGPDAPYAESWTKSLGVAARGFVLTSPSRVIAATGFDLRSFAAADGADQWTRALTAVTPFVDAGDLVLVGVDGAIHALDPATGHDRWVLGPWKGDLAPVARGGWVVAVAGSAILAARASDGSAVWQRSLDAAVSEPPVIDGDALFLATTDRRLVRLNLSTGATEWDLSLDATPGALLAANGRVYFGADDGAFRAYPQDADGPRLWRMKNVGDPAGAPVADAQHVYFASLDNSVRALDRDIGNRAWLVTLLTRPAGSLFLDGPLVGISASTGEIAFYAAKDGQTMGHLPPPKPSAEYPDVVSTAVALSDVPGAPLARLTRNGADQSLLLTAFKRVEPAKKK